jgi:hypothetical protein
MGPAMASAMAMATATVTAPLMVMVMAMSMNAATEIAQASPPGWALIRHCCHG